MKLSPDVDPSLILLGLTWLTRRAAANLPWQPAPPYGTTGACRGGSVLRRALSPNPIANSGASSSTRRLSLISTSVGTRGPAC